MCVLAGAERRAEETFLNGVLGSVRTFCDDTLRGK